MNIFACDLSKIKMGGDMDEEKISNEERNNFVLSNKLDFLMPTEFMDILLLVYNF